MIIDKELIEKARKKWEGKLSTYNKMYEYYKGNTDIDKDYKLQTDRSNLKTKTNFIKKFVDEEVSYSLGNDITYISKSDNKTATDFIDVAFENLSKQHDSELEKMMLIFNLVYEIYYIEDKSFKAMVVPPNEGFEVKDNIGSVIAFARVIIDEDNPEEKTITLYTADDIQYLSYDLEPLTGYAAETHYFGFVPYGRATKGKEGVKNTLYNDIKGLQDAYETNLSDLVNEISDFRNAYLGIYGAEIDIDTAKEMKANGIMQFPEGAKAEWLLKNLNDSFIQNTLNTLEDKMYQLACHINHNEKMQSNLSGVALRSRLISLEEKCKSNQRALTDCIKTRLKALFIFLNKFEGLEVDWRDVKVEFTPNIPVDITSLADVVSKVNGIFSAETLRALFPWCNNPSAEGEKLKKEKENAFPSLDNLGGGVIE